MTIARPGRLLAVARWSLACVALVTAACATAAPPVPAPPAPSASSPTRTLIAALKAYEARVGFAPTGNFAATTNVAFPGRCYYTGKLELPESYQGLRIVAAENGRCPLDESEFDIFPYALETAATGSSAVTPALEGATLERLLMLVPHEDFHNQPEAQRAAPAVAEAAATLAGFITAAGFAREYFGPDTPIVRHLTAEAVLFASKAAIVNRYHDDVAALYAAHRAGRMPGDDVFDRKRRLFEALGQACLASGPAPVSFNRCPAVLNNAGLAFDRTYTREYPALFELAQGLDMDVPKTLKALRETLAGNGPGASTRLEQRSGRVERPRLRRAPPDESWGTMSCPCVRLSRPVLVPLLPSHSRPRGCGCARAVSCRWLGPSVPCSCRRRQRPSLRLNR